VLSGAVAGLLTQPLDVLKTLTIHAKEIKVSQLFRGS
jgi:hypothetical protein